MGQIIKFLAKLFKLISKAKSVSTGGTFTARASDVKPNVTEVPRKEPAVTEFHEAWSNRSMDLLEQCVPDLIRVANKAEEIALSLGMDLTITDAHRGRDKQEANFESGVSQLHFPDSKHNSMPSEAIHIQMYPVLWPQRTQSCGRQIKLTGRFYMTAIVVLAAAKELGIAIRWGGDWNMDGDILDNGFDDLAHFERYHV